MTIVMVLAAGYGTRLRPLTTERPKALVPVGDRPIIAHQLESIRAQLGSVSILVNAHHRAYDLIAYVAALDATVRVIEEQEILGTAGGLRVALEVLVEEPLLVVNSDVLSNVNYRELLDIVGADDIVMRIVPRPIGQGPVGLDAKGDVIRLRNESFGIEVCGGDYLGVVAIGAGAAQLLPARGCLVADFMLPWLHSGRKIRTLARTCKWTDVGTAQEYFRANMDWLRVHSLESWVSPNGTRLPESVTLKNAIVGEGARVLGDGQLHGVIVWPQARVHAPLENAVIASSGVIVKI